MLILSRRIHEDIIINDDITIRVISIQGDKVRLGITAPREQSVHRSEVYATIQTEATAMKSQDGDA